MLVWGAQYSFGVFFKPMLAEFGLTRAVISGAYSLNLILIGFFGIFTGGLSDKYGPRLVVTVCGSFIVISYLCMSQVNAVWQIYIFYGVLASIGAAGSWIPILSTIARWFIEKRGLMSGVAASGIGVGIIIMPLLANQMITIYSWRTAYLVVALILLVVVISSAQVLKFAPETASRLSSDQHKEKMSNNYPVIKGYSLKSTFLSKQFWMIGAIYFLLGLCFHTVMVHIVPHATDIGVSPVAAVSLLSVIGGVSILGKVGLGSAIDRLGNKPIIIIVSLLMLVSFIGLWFARDLWLLFVCAIIFAIGYGGFSTAQSPFVAELFGLKAHGAIFGLAIFASNIGGAIGPLIAGRLYDITNNYNWAFIICGLFAIIGLIVALLVKPLIHE
ncbi:MFS transporter [Chloroflexota bacterium]